MALTNIETNIILDLYDYDTTPTKIKAIQLDSNTRYVSAVIRNRSGIYDVGQTTGVTLTIIRPDKVGVQITGEPVAHTETTPDEQVITTYGAYAELSLVALAVKGNLKAQFMLKSGDQVLRTEIFMISCGEALDASTDTWAGEYQGYNLDELVQNVNSAVATVEGMEQDVSELKSGLNDVAKDLKGEIGLVEDQLYSYVEMEASTSPTGWRLNESDGLCSADSSYKLIKFLVTTGEVIRVVSNDRFQFQTSASVPSSGANNRVGKTYGQGEYVLTVPDGATYLIMSALVDGGIAELYSVNKVLNEIKQNTTNILEVTQPQKKSAGKTTLLDLGQDTTFESGVVFSCMFNNATTDNVTRAIVDLRESNGTHHYCTYNSLYDSNGKHLTTSAQTGRFTSKGFGAYSSSITFRYVDVYYNETNTPSGTLSDFMLEKGTDPSFGYIKPVSAVDFVARLDIKQIKESGLPEYWKAPLDTAEQTILSNRIGIASGDEFIFITDQHWASNAQKSSELIDRLMGDLSINFIVNGGDIVNTHNATKMGAVNEIVDYYKSFKHRHRILSTIGNHDLNNNNNPDSSLHLSPQELYWFMIKPEETWIDTDNSAYVNVYDNNSQKIRYIQFYHCYDSGFIQSVADALVAKMQSTPSDWTIVLISHAYWNGANPSASATKYANLILQTMDSITAKVALWLIGHNHTDNNTTLTSSGEKTLLIVGTTTDAVGQNPSSPVMTRGTATEQAFDVVQIDTTAKKIYMTRVGAGSDREFSY